MARTQFGVTEKVASIGHAQEPVQQTGVSDVDLGGADLAFGDVGQPGLHLPDHECVGECIEVAANGGLGDAECPGELGADQPRLLVGVR
jgi:hypothetical protein